MRICEICGTSDQDQLHRQNFIFPGQTKPVYYDVVACQRCGFAFASNIPDQSALNRFYQNSEHHLHQELPPGLARIHDDFFGFVRQYVTLAPALRILDVGSGMGHFLSRFRKAGLHDLTGIEPSPLAVRLGKDIYGLQIRTETVGSFAPAAPFGLITLCGVLEHIADLKAGLRRINALLETDGHLFIAVPDAASFGKQSPTEAFLEFALEHINFFSSTSLDNLLRQAGFESVQIESRHNDFYGNSYLLALYQKTADAPIDIAIRRDRVAAHSLQAYVELSRQRQLPVANIAAQLATDGEPLIVWGAGSLTSRLLCDTRLGEAKIIGIIDRNKALHGRNLLGFPITGPEMLKTHLDTTVLIASTTYAAEITAKLKGEYDWHGKIITLVHNAIEDKT